MAEGMCRALGMGYDEKRRTAMRAGGAQGGNRREDMGSPGGKARLEAGGGVTGLHKRRRERVHYHLAGRIQG